jgi:DNA-binding LacI/PurR family transcriptional regulator
MSSAEPAPRPTIKAVAKYAQVSYQTVSNALNAPERLRPDTLARVLRAVEELGYRPTQAARNLRLQTTRLIGFRSSRTVGRGIGAIEDRFLHALTAAARDRGYGVILFAADGDDDEIAMFEDLVSRGAVDGFVLSGSHRHDPRTAWLAERDVPFVSFGRPWEQTPFQYSWLDVDGRAGTLAATRLLAEAGHHRIGFIGWPESSEVGDDRHTGWLDATAERDLPTRGLTVRGLDGIGTGTHLAGTLLDKAHPPTAFVCVSDAMAVGAMHAIEHRGLAVGRDVAVIGFDDSPLATVVQPALSSVRQPLESIARRCVDLLLDRIADPRAAVVTSVVEPTVIARGSSATNSHPFPPPGA